LEADKISGYNGEMTQQMPTHLATVLNFTPEDLTANRERKLSEAQRARLQRSLLREAVLYGVAEAVIVVILLIAISATLQESEDVPAIILLGLALLSSIYPIYMVVRYRATRAELTAGMVERATGRVSMDKREGGIYRMEIGSRSFAIRKTVREAFEDGGQYHVYYAPRTKTILSAEPLA
jgi:hypothetical protein